MYIQLFWDIAKLLPYSKKVKITVDFEMKLIEALNFIFDCEIHGRYFHFSECLRKKAQKLGLLGEKNEKETNDLIKKLKSSCFMNLNIKSEVNLLKDEYQRKLNNTSQENQLYLEGKLIFIDINCF